MRRINTDRSLTDSLRSALVFILITLFLAAGIITVGVFSYRSYERNFRTGAEQQLLSITELKVDQLAQWRRERIGDGEVFYNNPVFSRMVRRFFDQPADTDVRPQLESWLEKIQVYYQYDGVFLLDTQAVERLTVPSSTRSMVGAPEHVAEALRSGRPVFSDFHRHTSDAPVVLCLLVPIYEGSDTNRPLGVLVLRIDPAVYLYPFIQRWPVPSDSAETLLVRREGDEVAFVNQLRFNTNAVLTVRSPLTDINLPAVQAVRGREGIFEGLDYRGHRVISSLHAVPDSPWFMVARRDMDEVFAPVRERLWQVVVMICVLIFGSASVVGLIWRHQRVQFYREKAETAEALEEAVGELSSSNRDLEQFAYIASHDLQEPLRMVANYVQLLERRYKDKLDQDAKDFIYYASDGAVRMQKLIDSLLEYSRLHSRQKQFKTVNLDRVLQRVLRDLEKRILESGAKITAGPLPGIFGDEVQLGQVFQNLISNALKFKGEDPPKIQIASEEFPDHWKITVRDNGIGIEPEYQEKIFKIFQRLHSRAEYPGTGIGLAVFKRIIERHGGTSGVVSEAGKGSSFWFTLPKREEI